ncbi:hypothetical protein Pint_19942 [Pistacia integerrima]|uniref:Uncharacterized protein n=1 Tax=Pistacia integerrima TaxID=434235 RepID=A0ACC0XB43_9ROSI|nr:hypothetical protein Pint_19942 [Pistacia integerrima]
MKTSYKPILTSPKSKIVFKWVTHQSSPAESGIMEDLGLSVAAYSVFGSIMTVGGMIGAILSGRIADILGRRVAMLFSDIFCTFGWFAIAFGKDVLWLDLGRLSIGFGIGLISYVAS